LAGPPARERPHGRYTGINLAWQRPGASERPPHAPHAATRLEEPAMVSCHHLSPLQGAVGHHLSPTATQSVEGNPGNTESCGAVQASTLSQPFQEASQDPEPTGRGPAGATTREGHEEEAPLTPSVALPDEEPGSEDDYTAATARLLAQGLDPVFLIRPVVLAEVQRVRDEVACGPAGAPGQAIEVPAATQVTTAPAMCPATPRLPQALSAPIVSACAGPSTRTPPPTLREVTLADLGDVGRLLALHQQARVRGWLRGGEAEQLNVVAAAVHARRVGQAPCRLFVALLRDRRGARRPEDAGARARALLRAQRAGPRRWPRQAPAAAVPEMPLSDDARLVLLTPQVLRQAGWRGEPFLGVKLQDPTWTRARWEHAQAELTQWCLRQAQARQPGSGLEPPAAPWGGRAGRQE